MTYRVYTTPFHQLPTNWNLHLGPRDSFCMSLTVGCTISTINIAHTVITTKQSLNKTKQHGQLHAAKVRWYFIWIRNINLMHNGQWSLSSNVFPDFLFIPEQQEGPCQCLHTSWHHHNLEFFAPFPSPIELPNIVQDGSPAFRYVPGTKLKAQYRLHFL